MVEEGNVDLVHGPGALRCLAEMLDALGSGEAALFTDPGVAAAGLSDSVLRAAGREMPVFAACTPEPRYDLVDECVAFLREHGCRAAVALGGGSTIDTTKMAAVMMTNEGGVPDYFGLNKVVHTGIPIIAIPTTAGTGSEVSPASVFSDPRDGTKKGVRSPQLLPVAAILDPVLTLTLPQPLTAATGMDALTHAIECYTSLNATPLSDMAAERSIELIGRWLPIAYANGSNLEARDNMLLASYLAGLTLSIANVGAVHGLAQTLGGLYHVRHGVANALFLPYVMAFSRLGCRAKYARVAAYLGEAVEGLSLEDASQAAVDAVQRLCRNLGIPEKLRDLGVPEEGLDHVAERCLETQSRIVGNNPRIMRVEDAKAILRQAY